MYSIVFVTMLIPITCALCVYIHTNDIELPFSFIRSHTDRISHSRDIPSVHEGLLDPKQWQYTGGLNSNDAKFILDIWSDPERSKEFKPYELVELLGYQTALDCAPVFWQGNNEIVGQVCWHPYNVFTN